MDGLVFETNSVQFCYFSSKLKKETQHYRNWYIQQRQVYDPTFSIIIGKTDEKLKEPSPYY